MKFNCEVKLMDDVIHSKTYNSLKEICVDLHLTYQQVADISSNRRNKFKQNKFKYSPSITIKKISCII